MKRYKLQKLQQKRPFVSGRYLVGIDPAKARLQVQILSPDGLPGGFGGLGKPQHHYATAEAEFGMLNSPVGTGDDQTLREAEGAAESLNRRSRVCVSQARMNVRRRSVIAHGDASYGMRHVVNILRDDVLRKSMN